MAEAGGSDGSDDSDDCASEDNLQDFELYQQVYMKQEEVINADMR